MQSSLPSHDVVLIGAGHTNMHVVRMWRMRPPADARLTLISPFARATYSGMLPGTLAGLYEPDDMEIDLFRFTTACGVRLIVDEAIGLDADKRRVLFRNRPPLRFDVASVGIGSVPAFEALAAGNSERVLSIKPMATFLHRLEQAVASATGDTSSGLLIHIVGGGAAGIEVACCLESWLRRRDITASVTVMDGGDDILPGYAPGTVRRARREFERRRIEVRTGQRAVEFRNRQLVLNDGTTINSDIVILATQAAPPPVLAAYDLPKADDGFLAVHSTLQTIADRPVLVVGDTATIVERPVRKAGVYAVREGPVLWDNIGRMLRGERLLPYDPQKDFLSLLSSGDGRAIGQYKGFSAHGRWVWWWKDYLDRKFMRMYQDYRPMSAMQPSSSNLDSDARVEMKCRGCGGKVGSGVLTAALERLKERAPSSALKGLDQPDDAAVLDASTGTANVVSVDFFTAFLDDPWLVGRVAALNSLSDLWAMGATPVGAMAMVTLPEGSRRQQTELLFQVLAGGTRELAAADAVLLGGHTTEGAELTIGYTVLGRLDEQVPLTKGNLATGDRLILTKPLGTGMLLAAGMRCVARASWLEAVIETMLLANGRAASVARKHGVHGATDVTGFGLAGHLLEMLDAAGMSARLDLDAIPLQDGVVDVARQGIFSSLDPANRTATDRIRGGDRESPAWHALFDPQTSGGLILAISAGSAESLLNDLQSAGYAATAIIGEVVAAEGFPEISIDPR